MSTTPKTHRSRPAWSMWARLRFGPDEPLDDRRFERFCQHNPDLRLERTAEGELIVLSPAGSDSGRKNLTVAAFLWLWNQANGLGAAFDSSAGFKLPSGAIRAPDGAGVAQDRWDALTPAEQKTYAPVCPDFVIKLRSPSDQLREVQEKMRDYIAQGTRLGWLIDPFRKSVTIYRPGRRAETLKSPSNLSGEAVLPGFVLDLKGTLND